jgi:aminoacyl tRNA synthase complex-interacting multifunctional protein 1
MDDITRLEFRVGQIKKVWAHPEAEKLWCEEIDIGEAQVRNIASGLRKSVSEADMLGARVVVLANLKAKNLRGFPSHGMVMCAVVPDGDGEKTALVTPPAGAKIGELLTFEGEEGTPDAELPNKKNPMEVLLPDLGTGTDGLVAWRGKKMVSVAGPCSADLKSAAVR